MRQKDTVHQRILNALLAQVRVRNEGRYNDICAFSEQSLNDSRNYLNFLLDTLYQKNWDADYSIQQRIDHVRESISELNKRIICLEEGDAPGITEQEQKNKSLDEDKINLFLDYIKNEIGQMETRQEKECLYLAVFTPLSPLKNGIADYMTVILLALKQYMKIDIYIDEGYEPDDPNILQSFTIYQHKKFHQLHEQYDLILYEIGNNPHHAYIVPYVLQYPGIVELHDFRLDYLHKCLLPKYQKIAWTESVCAIYPEGCSNNPLNLYLLKVSRGILVHSEFSRQAVFDESMTSDVRKIEHFAKTILDEQDTLNLVRKHGLEDCFVISCFGFVNYTKRIEQIIISFSNIVQKHSKTKFKLLIVGEFTKDYLISIKSLIRKHHLKKYVVMTGYVSLGDMYKYISLTDICMNLRYPYGGESSGTLARIMGMGKACIVNRIGAFDEIPDSCCHKIAYESNLEKEIENITNAMSILFENSTYRKWIAGNAQTYVMEHLNLDLTIQLYCESLDHFYHKTTFDIDRLMRKAASFLAYNYFDNPYNAAMYLTSQIYPFFYGEAIDEQQPIEQVSNPTALFSNIGMGNKYEIDDFNLESYEKSFLEKILQDIQLSKCKKILEVGCGAGNFVRALAYFCPQASVIGIDPYLKEWWKTGEASDANWEIRIGDGQNIPYPADTFDLIVSIAAFEHIPSPEKCLKEIKRVLKPKGLFITSFSPIWSGIFGHHCEHWIVDTIRKIPPWGHLYLSYDEMLYHLEKNEGIEPERAKQMCYTMYQDPIINRIDVKRFEQIFSNCGMEILEKTTITLENRLGWLTGEKESELTPNILQKLDGRYTMEELRICGYSLTMQK